MFKFAKINCGNSSVGRALASQAEGRGFESRFPLKKKACFTKIIKQAFFNFSTY